METTEILERASFESWTDQEIVDRVKAGDTAVYEIIMRRYNQRILRGDAESEDVMQDAYVRAYQHLDQFEGRAPFPTWLTRIAVHEALTRVRTRKRNPQLNDLEEGGELLMNPVEPSPGPEDNASRAEVSQFLEEAVLGLPEQYRVVVMLRDIDDLSTAETVAALDLTEENLKVRLHRGRAMAPNWLLSRVGAAAKDAFPFMGVRCDGVVAGFSPVWEVSRTSFHKKCRSKGPLNSARNLPPIAILSLAP